MKGCCAVMKSMKKTVTGIFLLFTWLFMAVLYIPQTVLADSGLDVSREGSLKITYECSDAVFRIFRAAEASENLEFRLSGDFAGYPVSLEHPDGAGWREAADTLAVYAQRDQIKPAAEGKTDKDGTLVFANLAPGLYLVTGEPCSDNGCMYTPAPFLVSVPNRMEDGAWDYHPEVTPKFDKTAIPTEDKTSVQVVKIWRDDGHESERPEHIVVQLLKDGEVFEEQTLDASNGWQYVWTGLDAKALWRTAEKEVPEKYRVGFGKEGDTFIITNSYAPQPLPEKPNGGGTSQTPPGNTSGKLPQTGQLWWPVPLLGCLGFLFLAVGMIKRKKRS